MENNKKLVGAILATGLMSFAGVLIETAMNVTFPTLIDQFTLSTSDVQWVTTIYLLVISIIVPISTYLLKRFSLRTLFMNLHIVVYPIASVLKGHSPRRSTPFSRSFE